MPRVVILVGRLADSAEWADDPAAVATAADLALADCDIDDLTAFVVEPRDLADPTYPQEIWAAVAATLGAPSPGS